MNTAQLVYSFTCSLFPGNHHELHLPVNLPRWGSPKLPRMSNQRVNHGYRSPRIQRRARARLALVPKKRQWAGNSEQTIFLFVFKSNKRASKIHFNSQSSLFALALLPSLDKSLPHLEHISLSRKFSVACNFYLTSYNLTKTAVLQQRRHKGRLDCLAVNRGRDSTCTFIHLSLKFANLTSRYRNEREQAGTLSTNELMEHARSSYYDSRIRHPSAGRPFN